LKEENGKLRNSTVDRTDHRWFIYRRFIFRYCTKLHSLTTDFHADNTFAMTLW